VSQPRTSTVATAAAPWAANSTSGAAAGTPLQTALSAAGNNTVTCKHRKVGRPYNMDDA